MIETLCDGKEEVSLNYQKLPEHQLVELDGEMGFVIVTEIDLSHMKNGIIFMRGQSYNYESGEVKKGRIKEIEYVVVENVYYDLDENGKIID